jgi:peptide-methionine (R)-S-oxide reductase
MVIFSRRRLAFSSQSRVALSSLAMNTLRRPLPAHPAAHGHDDPRYEVRKSDAQWQAELDPMQYQVTRHAATERAFTGRWWDHFEAGSYRCVGCGEPLFEADTKFDAGCGWPSFSAPIEQPRVERLLDASHGMVRVEVRCQRCGSHLGHVFDDGPGPAGERFCINSAAIDFEPAP